MNRRNRPPLYLAVPLLALIGLAIFTARAGTARTAGARVVVRHLDSHRWTRHVAHPTHAQRVRMYRTIAAHDRYVRHHRRLFSHRLVARHARELRHAKAHLRKLLPPAIQPLGPWHSDLMTTYSWAEGGQHGTGCGGYLENDDLTFASYQVACGMRVQFCYVRCAIGVRTDSGPNPPGVNGWLFDLNYGLAVAVGHPEIVCPDGSCSGGVGRLRWRVVR